jgi:hypothetical protein
VSPCLFYCIPFHIASSFMADLSNQTAKPSRSVVFTIVSIIVIFIGCRATPHRLQQSEVNTCFKFTNDVPFEEYIRITRSMIEKTHIDINERNKAIMLEANSHSGHDASCPYLDSGFGDFRHNIYHPAISGDLFVRIPIFDNRIFHHG